MRKSIFSLLFIFSIFTSCVKDDIKSQEKELLSFTLKHDDNPQFIVEDIEAVIQGSIVRLSLPENIDITNLIASFEFNGAEIMFNQVEQFSGISQNDYSEDSYYEIFAEDGSQITYRLIITPLLEADLRFVSFSFQITNNQPLKKDYHLKFIRDTVHVHMQGAQKKMIATFETAATTIRVNGENQESSTTEIDFSSPVAYALSYYGALEKEYVVFVHWNNPLPQFSIETEGSLPIVSKNSYIPANLSIDGVGAYDDFEAATEIRGRGNSTWGRPKKPYRIKLNKKASILGLKTAKNWVLLANHFDETLMLNAVAMKMGRLLGMEYTNQMIPVEVRLNGEYLGNYVLTEQIEGHENRVNVKTDGVILELDSYFKNDWKFKSSTYDLPIEIKYPKLKNYAKADAEAELAEINSEFSAFENKVFSDSFPNSGYQEVFDQEALVDYLIVYLLTGNGEINHPKSTYMYKEKGGRYTMGPIWDFDWAFSFDGHSKHFNREDLPLFWDYNEGVGTKFFRRLLSDPATKQLLLNKWNTFKSLQLDELFTYIDDYAGLIESSQIEDRERWNVGSIDFKKDVLELKSWIRNRATYLDSYIVEL